jgi:hypothetical protein
MSDMTGEKHRIAVKTALAEKYERLARNAGSAAKQKAFSYRATKYRRQLQQMGHEAKN